MLSIRRQYSILSKAIAIAIVCLFSVNMLTSADVTIKSTTLHPGSLFTNGRSRAEAQALQICKIIEKRALEWEGKIVEQIYLDDVALWKRSIFLAEGELEFKLEHDEIRIYLPESNICIRYYNPAKRPTAIPDTDLQRAETHVIDSRIDEQNVCTEGVLFNGKAVKIKTLTKEFAKEHVDRLVELKNTVPDVKWIPEQFLRDIWEEGDYGLRDRRVFLAKWKHSVVAVDSDNNPIGLLLAYEIPAGKLKGVEKNCLYVHEFVADPEYHKMGIGSRMMHEAANNLLENGFVELEQDDAPTIALKFDCNTPYLVKVYENLGFHYIDEEKIEHPNGEVLNEYIYGAHATDVLDKTSTVMPDTDLQRRKTCINRQIIHMAKALPAVSPRPSILTVDKSISKTTQEYKKLTKSSRDLIQTLISDPRNPTLLRIPIEWLDIAARYIGEKRIRAFLHAFQKDSHGYIELYYATGISKEDRVSQEVATRYGVYKPIPEGFKPSKENTISLFALLKGKVSPNPKDAQKDINRLLAKNLGHIDPHNTQIVPMGSLNDPLGLLRCAIMGLQLIHIAREKKQRHDLNKPADRLRKQLKRLYNVHGVEGFDLSIYEIIDLAAGNRNDRIRVLKKLIDLLPIIPIDLQELRDIYKHAAEQFA